VGTPFYWYLVAVLERQIFSTVVAFSTTPFLQLCMLYSCWVAEFNLRGHVTSRVILFSTTPFFAALYPLFLPSGRIWEDMSCKVRSKVSTRHWVFPRGSGFMLHVQVSMSWSFFTSSLALLTNKLECSFTGKPIGHLCNLNVMLEPIQVEHLSIGPFPRTMD